MNLQAIISLALLIRACVCQVLERNKTLIYYHSPERNLDYLCQFGTVEDIKKKDGSYHTTCFKQNKGMQHIEKGVISFPYFAFLSNSGFVLSCGEIPNGDLKSCNKHVYGKCETKCLSDFKPKTAIIECQLWGPLNNVSAHWSDPNTCLEGPSIHVTETSRKPNNNTVNLHLTAEASCTQDNETSRKTNNSTVNLHLAAQASSQQDNGPSPPEHAVWWPIVLAVMVVTVIATLICAALFMKRYFKKKRNGSRVLPPDPEAARNPSGSVSSPWAEEQQNILGDHDDLTKQAQPDDEGERQAFLTSSEQHDEDQTDPTVPSGPSRDPDQTIPKTFVPSTTVPGFLLSSQMDLGHSLPPALSLVSGFSNPSLSNINPSRDSGMGTSNLVESGFPELPRSGLNSFIAPVNNNKEMKDFGDFELNDLNKEPLFTGSQIFNFCENLNFAPEEKNKEFVVEADGLGQFSHKLSAVPIEHGAAVSVQVDKMQKMSSLVHKQESPMSCNTKVKNLIDLKRGERKPLLVQLESSKDRSREHSLAGFMEDRHADYGLQQREVVLTEDKFRIRLDSSASEHFLNTLAEYGTYIGVLTKYFAENGAWIIVKELLNVHKDCCYCEQYRPQLPAQDK